MIYESIIGLCVLCYLLWKFLLSNREQIKLEECKDIDDFVEENSSKKIEDSIVEKQNVTNNNATVSSIVEKKNVTNANSTKVINTVENTPESIINYEKSLVETDLFSDKNIHSTPNKYISKLQNCDVIIESFERKETTVIEKVLTRESPPKERFAEFLEKTFSDDKIQSIIQNLSLDTEFLKSDSHVTLTKQENKHLDKELKPLIIESNNTISEKAVKLQQSIDEIADKIKLLSNVNITKDKEVENERLSTNNVCVKENLLPSAIKARSKLAAEAVEIKHIEDKPFLNRIKRQSGLPTGLNFGSVIGELKSKTKSSSNGLKPVFKKFDINADTVDNSQVNKNLIIIGQKSKLISKQHKPKQYIRYR